MPMSRDVGIDIGDGSYPLRVWPAPGGAAPVVLVLQEIFGLDAFVDDTCERVTGLGFTAVAPDLYWRSGPGTVLDGEDPEQLATALDLGRRLDVAGAVADLGAVLDGILTLPESAGRVAAVGFCLGGTVAFLLAAADDRLAACVSYYGAGVPGAIDRLEAVTCPTLFHFGSEDPVISRDRVARVAAAAEERPDVTVEVADGAGHAFANHRAAALHHPEGAAAAWRSTSALLTRVLRRDR